MYSEHHTVYSVTLVDTVYLVYSVTCSVDPGLYANLLEERSHGDGGDDSPDAAHQGKPAQYRTPQIFYVFITYGREKLRLFQEKVKKSEFQK